ncbi:MAG: hypothetical protein Q7T33_02655 [Dehalococcoidia bacterium]|nr:hypothetical protein [Dehalococcoidia bacterium]
MDLAAPIRAALLADSAITSKMQAYLGSFPIFTRRPVPTAAPYPVVVVSPDVTVAQSDGVSDQRPAPIRDVAIYGRNDTPASYRDVEAIAYAVRALFHRRRGAIIVPGWGVVDITAAGPRAAPVDDEQTVGRVVELTVQLARKD